MSRPYRDKPLVWVILDENEKTKIHGRLIEELTNGEFLIWCPVHERAYTAKNIRVIPKEDIW